MISTLMSLADRMPWNNSISLTWQMFGYISWGEGIWQQLLSSETWEPETEVFSFSIVINSHPPWTLSSRFRDDVVMFFCFVFFREGTAHTSTENKHYSCFSFPGSMNSYHRAHLWMCLMLVFASNGSRLSVLSLNSTRWSHISERRVSRGVVFAASGHLCGFWCFTVRLCFLSKFDCFL